MRSIGVIGVGVVGGAVLRGFRNRGMRVLGFDQNSSEYPDTPQVWKSDALFLCLPTPTDKDGKQDLTALHKTFLRLQAEKFEGVICIKSTVLPGTTQELATKYGFRKVVHNPEFLTASRPYEDFMEQPAILIGGCEEAAIEIGEIYFEAGFSGVRILKDARITEMAKYMHNVFLALKVTYCNEIREICEHVGIPYDKVRFAALAMNGIGYGHTSTPGHDGQAGYGGMCFPKDTQAFLNWAFVQQGLQVEAIEASVFGNRRRRPEVM